MPNRFRSAASMALSRACLAAVAMISALPAPASAQTQPQPPQSSSIQPPGAPSVPAVSAPSTGIDIARMTCANYNDLRGADREVFLVWLYGYYAGAAQRTLIDKAFFGRAMQAVGDLCEKQRNTPIVGDVMRGLFAPGSQPGGAPQASAPGSSTPSALGPVEGAQRITVPQPGLDPATTSAILNGAAGNSAASRALLDALSNRPVPSLVPDRPTPE